VFRLPKADRPSSRLSKMILGSASNFAWETSVLGPDPDDLGGAANRQLSDVQRA
jgi:hypothetical protein